MEKNKSIDGLTVRSAKKATTKTPSLKPKTKPKTPPKKVKVSVAAEKPEKPEKSKKPKKSQKAKITHTQTVEDFLTPVQAFNFDGNTSELSSSDPISAKPTKSKKEKKKTSKTRRIITSISLVLVLILIGLISWAVLWGNDIIAKITGGQGNVLDLIKFIEPTYDPLKTDANGRTNILAIGTSGYNMDGDVGNGVHDGASLTDSIMLISINQDTGDTVMLSLPRDLKANTTCTATGKINEVYWCNNMYGDNEKAGAEALMTEVGNILGVDFQYYAHVNWGSLIQIVDTLGGITVVLDEDITDYYYTGADYKAGVEYTLNGDEAHGLARARHGTIGGDFSRGASQQKILIGIKNKVFEKDLSITDIVSLASNLGDNLRTNFSVSELKTLAHLTFDFNFDNIRSINLYPDYMTAGTLSNGISYVFPTAGVGVYGPIQALVAEQLSNDPRIYEHPSILVLNATNTDGVASGERTKLTEAGYPVSHIDNAPEDTTFTETYTIYSNGAKPGTAKLLEQRYNINTTPISEAPESISRDYDFVIILGPTPTENAE